MHRETLAARRRMRGAEHRDRLASASSLARALQPQGDFAEAARRHRVTLEGQGRVFGADQGELAAAAQMHRETLEVRRRVRGAEHVDSLASASSFACALQDVGDLAEAARMYRETREVQRRVLGAEHPELAALGLRPRRRTPESGRASPRPCGCSAAGARGGALEHAVLGLGRSRCEPGTTLGQQLRHRAPGSGGARGGRPDAPGHPGGPVARARRGAPDELRSDTCLAVVSLQQGGFSEAARMHRDTPEVQRRVLGAVYPATSASATTLACVFQDQGELAEAARVHREALEARRRALGAEHPDTRRSASGLTYAGRWASSRRPQGCTGTRWRCCGECSGRSPRTP